MTVASMFRVVAERQTVVGESVPPAMPKATDVTDSAMQKVLTFVPAEIIGLYIAGVGVFAPKTEPGRWQLFGVCVALIFLLMVLDYFISRKGNKPVPNWWRFLVLLALAVVGFTTWAAALPDTPFLVVDARATLAAGFIAPILAIAMPRIAQLLDLVKSA
jgi:hypothetical protein